MNRPSFFALIVLTLLATLRAAPAGAADVKYGDKPNVLFIAVDDLNHWVGYFGRNKQTATPNIDRLAARGVRFTQAYCAAPSCTPSRSALMSGMRPSTTGVYENYNDWSPAIPVEKCLPVQFKAGGYRTLTAGKIYHNAAQRPGEWDETWANRGGNPNHPKGFKAQFVPGVERGINGIKFAPLENPDGELTDYHTTDWTIDQISKKHDKPFFLACGLYKPHMPWNVPQKYYDMFPLDQIELPPTIKDDLADVPPAGIAMAKPDGDHKKVLESGRWKNAIQGYLAAIAYTDMNVGRVLDALDKSPHKDNTIIVFWGDHGWHLGEKEHWRKFTLWEEANRVPFIWVVPGMTKAGAVSTRTVDLMSIYPTLSELCGLTKPAHVEGVSIKPLLVDPAAAWETPAVSTFLFNNHTVRTEGWRYIRYADGGEELYDEAADPLEHTNLAGKPEHAERKRELARWLPKTNVPDPGRNRGERKRASDEE